MALTPGTRLGSYEITAQIGVGGMGEVYRAIDTNLKRQVAIKVLPASVAGDAERLARFQREAEVLAALNHPHIAAIYGLEKTPEFTALVMELVEGEDLSQRIARGALPIDEALPIAKQIAEALEAAHEQGIIHRDLKPANIKVRSDGTVKVLDFGLAKAMDAPSAMSPSVTQAPTITTPAMMTGVGMILGTAAYMAPEQARGKPVDKRADVWAFGAVLYEMLTCTRAFGGEGVTDTIVAVMSKDPDWMRLPSATRPRLRELLRRCLEKDAKRRLQAIGEARIQLEDLMAGEPDTGASTDAPSAGPAPAASSRGALAAWLVAAVAVVVAVALAVPAVRNLREAPPLVAPETRVDIVTPAGGDPFSMALSPDGRQIVFVAAGEGAPRLWLRSLDATLAQPLVGTEGAQFPFWSPDSRSVAFYANGQLQRLDLGGSLRALASAPGGPGGTWSADDTILFAPSAGAPLFRISAAGGNAVAVTTLERQNSHRWPVFLPDGRHFLFYALGGPDSGGIFLGTVDGAAPTRLTAAETAGTYLQDGSAGARGIRRGGWLLWVRAGTLVAQRLDLAQSALTGDAVSLADAVASDGSLNRSGVSVSVAGLVAYRAGDATGRRQLIWRDRTGTMLGTLGAPDDHELRTPSVAPDGRRVAVSRLVQGNTDLWLLDGVRVSRLTFATGTDRFPLWSPDGTHIVFDSERTGARNLYLKEASGAGNETLVVESSQIKVANDWSADGRFLLYQSTDPQGGRDIWVRAMTGDTTPWPFLKTPFDERQGQFSPDGRWIAYQSNESGRAEIHIRPFAVPASAGEVAAVTSGQWQVSTAGGTYPSWRADGLALYYLGPDGAIMEAPLTMRGAAFEPGMPAMLFPTRIFGGGGDNAQGRQYDVTRDGRFLINTVLDDATATPITLLQNWRPPTQ